MSKNAFYSGSSDSLAAIKKNIQQTSNMENDLWDCRGLYKDNQVIKKIELIYDLREIKHMFCPYISFLNSFNPFFKLQQPINQRMCTFKTALNRRCKAKIRALSHGSLTCREVKTTILDSDSSIEGRA